MEDLSVFVRYYPDKNFESQLSADKKILVKVRALMWSAFFSHEEYNAVIQIWFRPPKRVKMIFFEVEKISLSR